MNKQMKALLFLTRAAVVVYGVCSAQGAGPVTIGGVTYDHVDPGEPFKESPRPEQNWELPKPTSAEQASGLIPYVTSDPGDYKPYRIPRPEEHLTKLSAFLTPGEDEPVWVGVYGLTKLEGLTLSINGLPASVTVDVRHLHFWPQRTGTDTVKDG